MMTKLNHVLLAGVVALACTSCRAEKEADYQVIPLPQEVSLTQEKPFLLSKSVSITYPEGNALLKRNAEFLSGYIRQSTGYAPRVKALKEGEMVKNAIGLGLDADIADKEGYTLTWMTRGDREDPRNSQYFVIYRFAPGQSINLDDPSKIAAITRYTECYLPATRTKYRYVVTAVDRFHNESKGKKIKVK